MKFHTYHDGSRSYKYAIEVSENGDDWKRVVDMTMNPGVHVNELMVFKAEAP